MTSRRSFLNYAGAILTPALSAASALANSRDAEIAKANLRNFYISTVDKRWFSSRASDSDGKWPDINYRDESYFNWDPIKHLQRIQALFTSENQGEKADLVKASLALRAWLRMNLKPPNWWYEDIGIPLQITAIILVANGQLSAELQKRLLEKIPDLNNRPASRRAGQNIIWYETIRIAVALIEGDEAGVEIARENLQNSISIGEADGIQPDYSFHQHGPQLYTGTYGLSFLTDTLMIASVLRDTKWRFDEVKLKILREFIEFGVLPLFRHRWFDIGALGRSIGDPMAETVSVRKVDSGLLSINLLYRNGAPLKSTWRGSRYFWRSQIMVHQTETLYCSIKINSNPYIGGEAIGTENSQGYWLSYGRTIFQKEKAQSPPPEVWDFARMPGTTTNGVLPRLAGISRQLGFFAGGVTAGNCCVAAIDLVDPEISAKKAYFVCCDLIVCLGTDIEPSGGISITTVDQALYQSPFFYIDDKPARLETSVKLSAKSMMNGQLKYSFFYPEKIDLDLASDKVGNQWLRIAFSQMQRGHYCYSVSSVGENASFEEIENNSKIQAINFKSIDSLQAVFHSAGSITWNEGSILAVDGPCIVIVTLAPSRILLSVSAVSERADALKLKLTLPNTGRMISFSVPTDRSAAPKQADFSFEI